MTSARRVLIYRLGSLGDTVVALPALRLVARAFPDAERRMLTNFSMSTKAAPVASVLEGTGLVHGYLEYPLGLRDLAGLFRLRRDIRRFGPDVLVISPHHGTAEGMARRSLLRLCGIRRLIGVPYDVNQQRPLQLRNDLYEYEGARLLRCLKHAG